jgi:hypothetical protein
MGRLSRLGFSVAWTESTVYLEDFGEITESPPCTVCLYVGKYICTFAFSPVAHVQLAEHPFLSVILSTRKKTAAIN